MASLSALNAAPPPQAASDFQRCCGSKRWADAMAAARPFKSEAQLLQTADDIWKKLDEADWREAFSHHPKIGDRKVLAAKFKAPSANWAAGEQAGVHGSQEGVLDALADGNRQYEARFGYIFIVCATGKSASEMLALLKSRLGNNPKREIQIAAEEQRKITRIRLEKLIKA